MKVILQRVNFAKVSVEGITVGEIEKGLLLLVGFGKDDSESVLKPMAAKISNLRVFPDEKGRFHLSVLDIEGGILAVPQFTLFADTSKGRRPEFFSALAPDKAEEMFNSFVRHLKESEIAKVETGQFGAYMQVTLENDGPVTIIL